MSHFRGIFETPGLGSQPRRLSERSLPCTSLALANARGGERGGVSLTLRSGGRSYELVVRGASLCPVADALDGFEVIGTVDGCTHMAGRIDGQGQLYDVLALVGASDIDLVSLRPMTDGLE